MRTLLFLIFSASALAQYNPSAGQNEPPKARLQTTVIDAASGKKTQVWVEQEVARDPHGNAAGNQHDLATDGAFEGQTVAVIQLYSGTDHGVPFDFKKPTAALKEKGFSVFRWINTPPPADVLEEKLKKASQLWVIGGMGRQLTPAHVQVIKRFFDSGRGVYLWGENAPYSSDANAVAQALFGVALTGGSQGEKVVGVHRKAGEPGVIEDHLLTTGIQHLYEGHTIQTLPEQKVLLPLIYGSDGRLVAGYFDKRGRRAIVDGGFTRLYLKWDTAGTGRYVKNAAAWLANVERFGAVNPLSSR